MYTKNLTAIHRFNALQKLLLYISPQRNLTRAFNVDGTVTVDDETKQIRPPKNPEFVPQKYLTIGPDGDSVDVSQTTLHHLRWMLQKDQLGQDMFLLGRPGPLRRSVAMQFLELTQRELEYISLSRDTTESDLKQRREIQGGTAVYFDQSAVRAAIEGRILVIEGVEKAERNVLPVLNNLLENREMHLEDGRFLIPSGRYDKLLQQHNKSELDRWGLVRVSEDFRVIALGLPVPKYRGAPLDPPLRSRFQARDVTTLSYNVVGGACGYHCPYTFFKGILISPVGNVSAASTTSSGSDIKQSTRKSANDLQRRGDDIGRNDYGSNNNRSLVLTIGDFVPVRPWSDSSVSCFAEIRKIWKDKNEQSLLTELRLYFLPENTPIGRNCHGEASE